MFALSYLTKTTSDVVSTSFLDEIALFFDLVFIRGAGAAGVVDFGDLGHGDVPP
jgi:hypothetical protein